MVSLQPPETLASLMSEPALLLIDVQQGFGEPIQGNRNNPKVESCILKFFFSVPT